MKQYYECPDCGAHLDSMSEVCECQRVRVKRRLPPHRIAIATCDHFMERYDRGTDSGLRCRFRMNGDKLTTTLQFRDRAARDAHYENRCCDDPSGCEICQKMTRN